MAVTERSQYLHTPLLPKNSCSTNKTALTPVAVLKFSPALRAAKSHLVILVILIVVIIVVVEVAVVVVEVGAVVLKCSSST